MSDARLQDEVGSGGVEVIEDAVQLGQLGGRRTGQALSWLLTLRRPSLQRSLSLIVVLLLRVNGV